jgi:hypothetical protein
LAILAVGGFHDLILFHQVHVLGPSIIFPEEKVLALLRSGKDTDCFKLLQTSLFWEQVIEIPKLNAFKSADSAEVLQNLSVPEMNPPKTTLQKCFGHPTTSPQKTYEFTSS